MKICFLGDIRSIHTKRWVEFFAKNHEAHLITFDYPEDESRVRESEDFFQKIGVTVHKVRKSFPFLPFSPLQARSIVRSIKPDIIHAHFVTQYGFFGTVSGVHPFVITAWGDDVLIHPARSRLYHFMVTHSLKKADLITCDGENTTNAMIDLGVDKSRIRRVYFGVDTNKFTPSKRDPAFFPQKFGFTDNKIVIYLRGFDPVYDTDTLFNAIPLILGKVPTAKFLLAGGGELFESYKQKVASSEYNDAVTFLGRVPNDELPVYIASSDICVSTSLSDSGIAASSAESMASGIPVVSTDCGDIDLWIKDGTNGFVIRKKDEKMLAERVITLLTDDSLRDSFRKRCRDVIMTGQDYYTEMSRMEKYYTDLVGGNKE
ncbi:MAG: glycosyltransferase [Methanoregulaceae archaeon]